jgi:hypothetical protein
MVAKALGKAERLLAKILTEVVDYRGLFHAQIVLHSHRGVARAVNCHIIFTVRKVTCRRARGLAKDAVEVKGKCEESGDRHETHAVKCSYIHWRHKAVLVSTAHVFFQPWSGEESTDPKQVYSES